MKGRIWLYIFFLTFCSVGFSQNAFFVIGDDLVGFDTAAKSLKVTEKVGEYFGLTDKGSIVAGLGEKTVEQGYDITKGYTLAVLTPQGALAKKIQDNILRAYPAPKGASIAFIDIDHDPFLYNGEKIVSLSIPHKVIQFAWLPDASGFVLTGKPSDWSPKKINNPQNTEEFMRLADSNLFLYKPGGGEMIQLTTHPREDWNPAVSPDGKTVLFQSSRINYSCFWSVNIDGTGLQQITFPKPELKYDGNIPIAYTDQLYWNPKTESIVFGTSRPDYTPEIWEMTPDGSKAAKLAIGRKPQIVNDGDSIAFVSQEGKIKSIQLSGRGEGVK